MSHYVYFIRPAGLAGPVKIGCSEMPIRRLKAYLAWSPVDLEIVARVPGTFDLERLIHHAFRAHHKRGEWFNACDELNALIDGLAAGRAIEALIDLSHPSESLRHRVPRSEDGKQRQRYWMRLHWAYRRTPGYDKPADVERILDRWSGYTPYRGNPQPPTAAEIARLEEVIANPSQHGVRVALRPMRRAA